MYKLAGRWLWLLTSLSVTCTSCSFLFASFSLRRHAGFGFLTFEDEDSVQHIVQERFVQIAGKQVQSLYFLILSSCLLVSNLVQILTESANLIYLMQWQYGLG